MFSRTDPEQYQNVTECYGNVIERSLEHFIYRKRSSDKANPKKFFVSGPPGDEKNTHPAGRVTKKTLTRPAAKNFFCEISIPKLDFLKHSYKL